MAFDDDPLIEEQLERATEEPDILGVDVVKIRRPDYPWQVGVPVMEFVRHDPLEAELRSAIERALLGVVGVTAVAEEDRELWMAVGALLVRS